MTAVVNAAGSLIDPATSLPCSLSKNPRELVLSAASRSIDINERHHPFCGLLVSMHQAGLYTGRFGLRLLRSACLGRSPCLGRW